MVGEWESKKGERRRVVTEEQKEDTEVKKKRINGAGRVAQAVECLSLNPSTTKNSNKIKATDQNRDLWLQAWLKRYSTCLASARP
jgi:hypothetical protein